MSSTSARALPARRALLCSARWQAFAQALVAWFVVMLAATDARGADTSDPIAALINDGRAHPIEAGARALQLQQQTTPYDNRWADALLVRGMLLKGRDAEAARGAEQALESAVRQAPSQRLRAHLALLRAVRASLRNARDEAVAQSELALELLPADASNALRLFYLNEIANVRYNAANLQGAAALWLQAVTLADQTGPTWRRAQLRYHLAGLYLETGQLDRARQSIRESIAIAQPIEDWVTLSVASNVYSMMMDNDAKQRLALSLASIDYARRAGDKFTESLFLSGLSDFYLTNNEPRQAIRYGEQALSVAHAVGNLQAKGASLLNLGLAHIALGHVQMGKRFAHDGIELLSKTLHVTGVAQIRLELGTALEKAGDAKGAIEDLHEHRRLVDQWRQGSAQRLLIQTLESFDADQQLVRLAALNRENQFKAEQLRRAQLHQRATFALSSLSFVTLGAVAWLYQRVRSMNRRLTDSNRSLAIQSEQDPLTQLGNRRHLQAQRKAFERDGALHAALLLIDIDHFKRINDTHGHDAGDAVLVEVAERLRRAVRDGDVVVRWGGEEFLLMMRSTDAAQTQAMAQRLLRALADTPVTFLDHPIGVTASIGYAVFPTEAGACDFDTAISRVDQALYVAKASGRNRAACVPGHSETGAPPLGQFNPAAAS